MRFSSKITHSGVCGTDERFLHTDMGLDLEGFGVIKVDKNQVETFQTFSI